MNDFILWGAIVNAAAVVLGGGVGLILKHGMKSKKEGGIGDRLSERLFQGVGLCVFLIGVSGAIKSENTLVLILSIVFGALIGEALDLDKWVNRLGDALERKMGGKFGSVAQGFVSASLLFCVGSMSILGPLDSGIRHDHTLQYTKSLLDMISSVVFGSSLGFGVILSAGAVLLFQGSLTLLAGWMAPLLSAAVITEMSAVGCLLIAALSFNMLKILKIKVMNFMPAIFMPIALIPLFEWIGI